MKSGGWKIVDNEPCKLPQRAATAFSAAFEKFVGGTYVPVLFAGTQLVAGTNYAIICEQELAVAEPEKRLVMVVIYENLEGECTVTEITPVLG